MHKRLSWSEIEKQFDTLRAVDGGFSRAERGIVTLDDDSHIFVKRGLHKDTKIWAKKEIAIYRFLEKHHYPYMPKLLAANHDQTGFATSAHIPEEGWDWKENWSEERLDKTLEAMDALAAIRPEGADRDYLSKRTITEDNNGWKSLLHTPELQAKLQEKLRTSGQDTLAHALDFALEADRSRLFIFRNDTLVHNDVRADNCAWNASTKEVRLVDWNWAQLGDKRLDLAATLTHIQRSGFDVLPKYAARLDAQALHWIAGFWLNSASKPIWEGGPAYLRDTQLQAGITALSLATKVDSVT